jgi:ketosteroid isomerase-like protein
MEPRRRDMTDDKRAIRELVETWLTATKAGDLSKVLSLMADDVVFMVPGQKPFGKEAFAADFGGQSNFQMMGRARSRSPGAGRLGLLAQPP